MQEDLRPLEKSLDEAFQKAEALNAAFEKSEKPRQRRIVEILHKHGLPAFIGPFFDAWFRITAQGGDIEKIGILMIARLSAYLGEDPNVVARKYRGAIADYVEFMSRDLGESGKSSSSEQFVPADG